MALAQHTVEIVERGFYDLTDGSRVLLDSLVGSCLEKTEFVAPEGLRRIRDEVLVRPINANPATIEVRNETTLTGAARLLAEFPENPVAALNFASAKNPGGGFLNGSEAQEESLARSSALYASLQRAPDYYQRHRASSSCLYSHSMIVSPDCPVFRNDEGDLLPDPFLVTFITSAAPNAGAIAKNNPSELSQIEEVLRQRAEYVLAVAAMHNCPSIVLGAWGCGVFRNDPETVARIFSDLLHGSGLWIRRFSRIAFSVLDKSATQETYDCFRRTLV
jgi:uncharacterized protein (TIGR02452 family)